MQSRLVIQLQEALQEKRWSAIKERALLLNHLLLDPDKRQSVAQLFTNQQIASLNKGEIPESLEIARLFSANPSLLIQQIHEAAAANFLELLPVDNSELSLTLPQIDLWLRIEQDPKARYAIATALLKVAEQLWLDETQVEKALNLSLAASSLPVLSEQKEFQKTVEASIRATYNKALQRNDLVLLKSIQKVLRELNLTRLVLQEHQEAR